VAVAAGLRSCGRERGRQTLALYHVRTNEPEDCIPRGPRPYVHQGNFTYKSLYKGEITKGERTPGHVAGLGFFLLCSVLPQGGGEGGGGAGSHFPSLNLPYINFPFLNFSLSKISKHLIFPYV
jgi:hypothetical protein